MGQDLTKLTPDELKARQIKEMDAEMKQKLQRGANYNMKVVIKGDKNTGKTCLWRRLQRMTFVEDYRSTEQIQIATIAWDYKATSDKIKVEVWDVVDKASKRKESGTLKLGIQGEDGLDVDLSDDDDDEERKTPNLPATAPGVNPQGSFSVDKLDAETVNVYKNCHAVLFMMDPRKKWTFDYIERELPNVPKSTFVLILVNYKDVPQNQRVISEYEIQEFARNSGKFVRCLECSMRNCYGMKGIRCFFNLPFLKLKRQYIIQQLKENEADLDAADQELDLVNSEQNYDFYLKWLEENRKNMKATAQATSVLPEGPPPRAAIDNSKNADVTAASIAEDPKMQSRTRSTSVPQNPATARQPGTPVKPPAPVANTAVRGGVTGGFGSYSHALPKSASTAQPAGPAAPRPAQQPQPTTPQRPATAAAAPRVPPAASSPAAKPDAPAEGGLMSWTSKLFTSPAKPAPAPAPKREVRDVVADLQKLAKDPARAAQSPTSVEDFVPPTEGGDDFWGGDDDDDDDDDARKANVADSDDEDGGRSLIAKDEDLDDDDDDDDNDDDDKKMSPAAVKEKQRREREEREQREREVRERERQRKEKEERERRERERAQAEALRRQFEQQEAAAAAAAHKPGGGGGYEQVSDDDDDDDDEAGQKKASAANGSGQMDVKKKKEKSIWGTKEEDSDDDDDDDDDNEAWGLPPKRTDNNSSNSKKKSKSNPFLVVNDEDLPSDDDDGGDDSDKAAPLGKQQLGGKSISASMGSLPSAASLAAGEKQRDGERRREDKERDRDRERPRKRRDNSYGDLSDASGSTAGTPEGERKERKSRHHRHRDRDEKGNDKEGTGTPDGERKERKSRHRHHRDRDENGSGERESRRSSRSKRSHHRSRSASPTPPS